MSSEAGGQEREAQRQLAESLGTPSYVDLTDEIARLEAALAASQERERQLREALEQIEQLDRMGHNSEVAAEMGYIARVTPTPLRHTEALMPDPVTPEREDYYAERLIRDLDAAEAERNLTVVEQDARRIARGYLSLAAQLEAEREKVVPDGALWRIAELEAQLKAAQKMVEAARELDWDSYAEGQGKPEVDLSRLWDALAAANSRAEEAERFLRQAQALLDAARLERDDVTADCATAEENARTALTRALKAEARIRELEEENLALRVALRDERLSRRSALRRALRWKLALSQATKREGEE